jgi:hypothetical protein
MFPGLTWKVWERNLTGEVQSLNGEVQSLNGEV